MKDIQPKKLNGLDHLRAFAIIQVFFFHYFILSSGKPNWLPKVAEFGWTGVDLFFVLSGFLISSQLFTQIKNGTKISFTDFFIKRFFRIIPAFWVVTAIYFLFPFFREKEALPPLWKFITFTQNLELNLKYFGTFSHAWSLCVEEHFYIFLPLILILLQNTKTINKGYWLIICLFIFSFAIRLYCYNALYIPKIDDENNWIYWYKYIYYPTYNRLDGLLVGISIAGIYVFTPTLWKKISNYGNLSFLLSLVILVSAYFICTENNQSFNASIFGFPLIAIGYGFMVISAVSPKCFLYKWNSKVTTLIATISYALYLSHKGMIHITHYLLENYKLNDNLILIICIFTSIIGALILNTIIEKPFMKLRVRFLKKVS